jgi:hypothetical protein
MADVRQWVMAYVLTVAFDLFICLVQSQALTTFHLFFFVTLFDPPCSQLAVLFLSLIVAQLISRP